MTERSQTTEKRQIPADLMPLLQWFDLSGKGRDTVAYEIASLLSLKVLKANAYKPEFNVGSEVDLEHRRRVMSCAIDIIKEELKNPEPIENIEDPQDYGPTANAVSHIVRAFKSGAIKDGKFWNNDDVDHGDFMKAQDELFLGMEILALDLADRFSFFIQNARREGLSPVKPFVDKK